MKKLLFLLPVLLLSCKTVPSVIDTTQTDSIAVETIVQGKDLENTIDNIKVITDNVKDSGNIITEKETVKIIEYVDKASGQVKELNAKLIDLEKSRKEDNLKSGNVISKITNELIASRETALKRLNAIIILSSILALLIVSGILYVIIKLKIWF